MNRITLNLLISFIAIFGCYYFININVAILAGLINLSWVLIIWLSESNQVLHVINQKLEEISLKLNNKD
jgi:hypothetical protein